MTTPRPAAASSSPTTSAFFWLVLVLGVVALVPLSWQGYRSLRDSGVVREQGWTATRRASGWIVSRVERAGPADGRLERGDRILAVNGDARAARFGPRYPVREVMPGSEYRVQVERNGTSRDVPLEIRARSDPTFRWWAAMYLVVAAACYAVGMLMGLARPRDRTVQLGSISLLLSSGFMVWMSSGPGIGLRQQVLALALSAVFPLYAITNYHFLARFPVAVAVKRRWAVLGAALTAFGLALWAARTVLLWLRARGASATLAAFEGWGQSLAWFDFALRPALEPLYPALAMAAALLVLARNYRALEGPGDRRRIRLLVWGLAIGLTPPVLVGALAGAAEALNVADAWRFQFSVAKTAANAFVILAPLALAYAILKHRVLGVRVFLRLGLQYVLARNSLRLLVALPVMWIAWTFVAHRDRTVMELLLSGGGSTNLTVLAIAGFGLRFRRPLALAIDRRFFREAYDQEQILLRLIESVKQIDSLEHIAHAVCDEIDAALHVAGVHVFLRHRSDGGLDLAHSSAQRELPRRLAAGSELIAEMANSASARDVPELIAYAAAPEAAWLEAARVDLVVPITGLDRDLAGLILIGEKRSEEPFTAKDRNLLLSLAAQIGSVHEVLALRETGRRQRQVEADVLARLDSRELRLMRECPTCGTCYDHDAERCTLDGVALELSLPVERVVEGKYRLERVLGRGGMGAVYEATDLRLARRVAFKVMTGGLGDQAALRRFTREAHASARLAHPNIVRLYDYGPLAGDSAYLVLEFVPGVSWRSELRRVGAFSTALAAGRLDQLLDGIASAHASGVLHRDLKPENLLIHAASEDSAGVVKILDFGLAKVREPSFLDPKSRTSSGIAMGTFGYMSPEQFGGEEVDERTDVYAIGVIALESLTGSIPFERQTFHRAIDRVLEERLIRAAATDAQRELARVLESALAPARRNRFASAAEFRAALVPALRSCPEAPVVVRAATSAPGTPASSTATTVNVRKPPAGP